MELGYLRHAYQTIYCITIGLISKTIRATSGLKFDDAKGKQILHILSFLSNKKIFKERIQKSRNVIPESMDIHVCGVNTRVVQKVLSLIGLLSFIPGVF